MSRRPVLTSEEQRKIAESYAAGVPESIIQREYGVSHYSIYHALDIHNVPRRNFYGKGRVRASVIKRLTLKDIGKILDDLDSKELSRDAIVLKYNLKSEHVLREIIARRSYYEKRLSLLGDLPK